MNAHPYAGLNQFTKLLAPPRLLEAALFLVSLLCASSSWSASLLDAYNDAKANDPVLGAADDPETVVELLREKLTPRTAALYLSTPNNPTGRILPRAWVEAMVEWATAEGLWIVSDEVYEDYVYRGEHVATMLANEQMKAVVSIILLSPSDRTPESSIVELIDHGRSQAMLAIASKMMLTTAFICAFANSNRARRDAVVM